MNGRVLSTTTLLTMQVVLLKESMETTGVEGEWGVEGQRVKFYNSGKGGGTATKDGGGDSI